MADTAALKTSTGSSSDEEEEVFTYRLRIHDAHVEDGGKWRCEVKDKYGTVSTSCDLEIFENEQIKKAIAIARQESMAQKKEEQVVESEETAVYRPLEEKLKTYDQYVDEQEPRFLQSLRNSTVAEDGYARLSCIVSGNPKPTTKWYKDNIEIKADGRYDIVELRDGTNYIEFSSVTLKDNAIYKCEITSNIGQSSSEAKLTVKKKKKYSQIFKACDLDDHREMLSSLQQRISDNIEYTGTIETTGYKHRNEINMMKSIYATEREADLKLRCKWEEEQQLYFRNNLNNKCVVDSGMVLLRCYVVGKPPFRARWFKDGKMLNDNVYERHFIRTRGGSMSLEIPCATLSDTGEYMCEARNDQGRVTSTCYLQVEPKFDTRIEYEKPYFVQKMKHIHVHPGQDATFICIAKGNPKPGIIWYKDGKEIQNTSRITFHRQNNGGILKIHEARYSDTGLYKCEAHSMAGRAVSSAKLIVVESNGFLADFHCNHEKVELTSTALREVQEMEEEISLEQEVTFKETVSSVIFPRIPSFKSQLPESMEIKEGERLVLSCRVDGFPKPQVTWLRNSEVIKDSGSVYTLSEKSVHSLKIQNCVSERDAGVYTIRLNEGSKYQIESTCNIKVSGTISFKQTLPKKMQAKEGEKLVLRFNAEGNPKPEVKWTFNSQKLKDHCRTYIEGDSYCLEITALDSNRDSGEYTATITSGSAEKICRCEIQVIRAPTFSKFLPKYVQVENGSKLHLQCAGDGYPKPEATWFRNNKELEEDSYVKMTSSGDTYSLDIPTTECKRDSGGYIIRLTSGTFSCESSSHVDVTRAPTFLSSIPANLDISEGERLTLKCVVDGVPSPEVTWFRDGVQLVHGDYVQISAMEGRHSLQINKTAGNRDGGEYTVKLTTGTSQTEASCIVTILREPGFATLLPAEVQVQHGEKLLLECLMEGSPLPKVSWLYDGTTIRESDYVTIKAVDGKNSLEIANTDFRRDSGKYTVKVVGRSKSECTCNVDIKSGPIFTKELPEVYQVGLHESLILKCTVDGNPMPKATWLHYGKEIENSDIFQISSKGNIHMLQIMDPVYPRDCGVYTVRLTSEKGQKESSSNVDIMRAASFKQKIAEKTEVAAGEKLLLSCSVDGLPKPEVIWLYNGKELKDVDYVKFNISNDTYTMEIAEPQWKRDSGTYTAKLNNGKSIVESACEVQIKSDPVFSTPLPTTLQVKDGESIILTCNAGGNPAPKVVWLQNGKELDKVDYARLTSDGDKYTLKITSPDSKRDCGTYTVKLIGGSTTKESTCEIQIERKAAITEQLPKDATVKAGEKLCLSCKADGFPLPEVIWLRNGKEIKDESYVKFGFADGSYTMEISNPEYKRDSGTYTAKLVGKDSAVETTCDVQIHSPPKFSKPLSSEVKVKEGEKMVLTCACEGNPKPEVIWLLDGKELSKNDYLSMKVSDDEATLEIASPDSKRDSGKYTARLKSGSSTEECSCDVKISSPPVFTNKPLEKVQVKGSESLKLSCTVDGYPKPEVMWMHNDKNLKDSDYATLSCSDDTYTLEIKAPEYERDSGSYTIKLCGETKTVECKCDVELPKPPCFKKSLPAALDVSNGKPIALNCFIEGWPVPEVVWYHNGKKIESNEKIQVTSSEDMSTLEITKCSYPDDCGKYTAKIANSKDNAECSCTVNILSAPFFTAKLPENMEVDEGETIALKCRFDGNPKPQVKWLYNSNDIQKNEKAKITSGDNEHKLEIINPQFQKDSGTYTAQIKNNLSEETSICKVAVVTKGKTEETKEIIEEVESPIEELPQQQFETVQKEENVDKNAQNITPIIVICKDHQLSAAKIGDVPEFLESPSFKVPLNKEYYPLEMDENVRVECTVSGDPCPEVEWKKDGHPLDRTSRVKTWFDPETRLASVIIKRLKAEDSGEYECVAVSQGGTSVSKTTLHVKFLEMQQVETQLPPENSDRRRKPSFILPIKDMALQAGQSGKLECLFEGIPLPGIKWFKDGSEFLSIPGKVSINVTEGKATLEILSMESRYGGVYTCEATNIEGSTSVSANVTFKDAKYTKDVVDSPKGDPCKPVFMEALEENVTVPAGGSVAFKCTASGYPTPKFRWQKDLLDVVQSNRFIIETKIPGKSMLAIYNLNEKDSGLYICTARNSYGRTTCATNLRVIGEARQTRRMTWSEDAIQTSMKVEARKRSESIQMTSIQNGFKNGFKSKSRQWDIDSKSLQENIEVTQNVTNISSLDSEQSGEHSIYLNISETQESIESEEVFVTSPVSDTDTVEELKVAQIEQIENNNIQETVSELETEIKVKQIDTDIKSKENTDEMKLKISTVDQTKAQTAEDKRKEFQRKASDQDTTSEGVYVDVDETGRTVIKSEVHQVALYSPRKSIITIDTGVEFDIDTNNQQTSELESKKEESLRVLEGNSSISGGEDVPSVKDEDKAKPVEDVVDSAQTPKTETPVQEEPVTAEKQKQQEDVPSVKDEDKAKPVEDVVDSAQTPKTETPVQEEPVTAEKQKQQESPIEKKPEEKQIVPVEEKTKETKPQEEAKKEIPSEEKPKETAKEIPSEETRKETPKEITSEEKQKEKAKEIPAEEKPIPKETPSEVTPKTTAQSPKPEDKPDGNVLSKIDETDKRSSKKEEKSSATLLQELRKSLDQISTEDLIKKSSNDKKESDTLKEALHVEATLMAEKTKEEEVILVDVEKAERGKLSTQESDKVSVKGDRVSESEQKSEIIVDTKKPVEEIESSKSIKGTDLVGSEVQKGADTERVSQQEADVDQEKVDEEGSTDNKKSKKQSSEEVIPDQTDSVKEAKVQKESETKQSASKEAVIDKNAIVEEVVSIDVVTDVVTVAETEQGVQHSDNTELINEVCIKEKTEISPEESVRDKKPISQDVISSEIKSITVSDDVQKSTTIEKVDKEGIIKGFETPLEEAVLYKYSASTEKVDEQKSQTFEKSDEEVSQQSSSTENTGEQVSQQSDIASKQVSQPSASKEKAGEQVSQQSVSTDKAEIQVRQQSEKASEQVSQQSVSTDKASEQVSQQSVSTDKAGEQIAQLSVSTEKAEGQVSQKSDIASEQVTQQSASTEKASEQVSQQSVSDDRVEKQVSQQSEKASEQVSQQSVSAEKSGKQIAKQSVSTEKAEEQVSQQSEKTNEQISQQFSSTEKAGEQVIQKSTTAEKVDEGSIMKVSEMTLEDVILDKKTVSSDSGTSAVDEKVIQQSASIESDDKRSIHKESETTLREEAVVTKTVVEEGTMSEFTKSSATKQTNVQVDTDKSIDGHLGTKTSTIEALETNIVSEEKKEKDSKSDTTGTSENINKTSEYKQTNDMEQIKSKSTDKSRQTYSEKQIVDSSSVTESGRSSASESYESIDRKERKLITDVDDANLVRKRHDVGSSQGSLAQSEQSVKAMKQETISVVQETRQGISESSRTSSKMEILEVSAVMVEKKQQEMSTVATTQLQTVHQHHPPELIVPPNSERVPAHSDIELLVKVKASKSARATWYHDNKTVTYSEHTELVTEEEPLKK